MVTDVNVAQCAQKLHYVFGTMVHSLFIGLLLFEHCAQKWVSLLLLVILRKLRKKNVLAVYATLSTSLTERTKIK
jgi:hypothetical protein